MKNKIKYPCADSEEEYLNELYRAAKLLHEKHGKSIEYYVAAMQEDSFEELNNPRNVRKS